MKTMYKATCNKETADFGSQSICKYVGKAVLNEHKNKNQFKRIVSMSVSTLS